MFPTDAGEFDQIAILVSESVRVIIYISETEHFSDPSTREIELAQGDSYNVTFPNSLYLTIVSHQVESNGDYVISYRFNDRDPDVVIAAMTEEERKEHLSKTVVIKQDSLYKEW